jgi:hypothetical protein
METFAMKPFMNCQPQQHNDAKRVDTTAAIKPEMVYSLAKDKS